MSNVEQSEKAAPDASAVAMRATQGMGEVGHSNAGRADNERSPSARRLRPRRSRCDSLLRKSSRASGTLVSVRKECESFESVTGLGLRGSNQV
jgi:hypothetical protein